ncbi:hypothetical protein EMIHUDRAFT_432423 [Emiliania huxleyi CCMP1516]|uniref:Uncharacterized protein n=2 Tax=Emiliania huxleyi TaxID=2903 RepID=A0A0D3J4L2_EMIH1|nr:hypothetical protein EMIHUDRAFT_432423 [Emiliania huxleyi CCMP1516]EOD18447.1 hypothetical protein EMIHUDRAFT_432423 [Emiliania huxleyi CCMP1516]|eukprot:XP_005770876.1 hypothetical protein EMIHUDRAFT_432423 [Emiliania huxleyi CCMP1516]
MRTERALASAERRAAALATGRWCRILLQLLPCSTPATFVTATAAAAYRSRMPGRLQQISVYAAASEASLTLFIGGAALCLIQIAALVGLRAALLLTLASPRTAAVERAFRRSVLFFCTGGAALVAAAALPCCWVDVAAGTWSGRPTLPLHNCFAFFAFGCCCLAECLDAYACFLLFHRDRVRLLGGLTPLLAGLCFTGYGFDWGHEGGKFGMGVGRTAALEWAGGIVAFCYFVPFSWRVPSLCARAQAAGCADGREGKRGMDGEEGSLRLGG